MLWVELFDEEGSFIDKLEKDKIHLYPSTSVRYKIDLTEFPKSKYTALVVVDCGGDDVFGANYTLQF